MKSKTIILSLENEKGRGILTIYQEEDLLQCRIRLYNIGELSKFCKIGIYHNNEVYSSNLLKKDGVYTSSLVGDFDIDKDFYAAIIDTNNNNSVLLCGGTYAGFFFNNQTDFENKFTSNFSPAKIEPNFEIKPQANNNIFTEIKKEEISPSFYSESLNINQCNDECERCKSCKYKEFFYSQTNNSTPQNDCSNAENIKENEMSKAETSLNQTKNLDCKTFQEVGDNKINAQNNILSENDNPNEVLSETEKPNKQSVYENLKSQFKYVFENYPPDSLLNSLIENSKFVRIEEEEKSYSIGVIYENEKMKYICYAILCNYNTPAPEELGKHYQWLPLDCEDPLSEGYYVVFQDAVDLKIVEMS